MSKHKLEGAYEKLTGHPLRDQGNLKQTLCIQCAQRLINFSRFKDKSLRARALMMDLVEKHDIITRQHIEMINHTKLQLKSNLVLTTLGPDHCDLHIEHPSEDKQTELKETGHRFVVKVEGSDDDEETMWVDVDVDMKSEDYINIHGFVQDPLKYEGCLFQCTLCLEEFVHEHAYMQHMRMHLRSGGGDGECDTSQCEPRAAVSSSHSSLVAENRQAKPGLSTHAATDEISEPSTEEADTHHTHSSGYKGLTDCLVKLFSPRRDGSLTTPQEAVRSCVSQDIAFKDISYQATSPNGGPTTEYAVHSEEKVTVSRTVYICDFCPRMFKQKSLLAKHIQSHMSLNTFTCKICQYQPKDKKHLKVHMRTHTGEKPFCCKLCNYKCSYNSHLVAHVRTHTGEKPFCCKLCKYKSSQNGSLVTHMRTHTGEKPFCCKLCKYKCNTSTALVRHMRTHTGEKPYYCQVCKYKSNDKSALVVHMRTHTGEKPYSCKICKYKGSENRHLVRHMRTHTGEKPYCCELCEFKSSHNSSLVTHMRTHTGEKPFCCKLCTYKCTVSTALAKHMRTHTGEKPFCCKLCKYKSSSSSGLVVHMRTHTGEKPYSCELCESKFISNRHLVKHMITHTGEKPYPCELCESKFVSKSNLMRHMRAH
ncbi:zinc finger protein ZFP2-like [Maniola hyperantus]|uniref:zinc finger protein ZFP2-like n=1 Tax=Aphantopus hyperantus TaxID=2795564 RepID=UPI00211FDA10